MRNTLSGLAHVAPWLSLAPSAAGGWEPGIGDPSFVGWFTVFAYFAAAALCWRRRAPMEASRPQRVAGLWLGLCMLLLLLGVNKQLDLQTWFTVSARHVVTELGWYDQRRTLQAVLISVVGLGGLGCVAVLLWFARGQLRQLRLPLAGSALLISFVVIRAASFHHVDEMLGVRVADLRTNRILELGGIGLIAAGAWQRGVGNGRTDGPVTRAG
ncbi:MAG: hypothetical protein MJD61_20515 [Proteobacteria bacterium]|nr:hypothetical protein [Pseudomonadota bacterium]